MKAPSSANASLRMPTRSCSDAVEDCEGSLVGRGSLEGRGRHCSERGDRGKGGTGRRPLRRPEEGSHEPAEGHALRRPDLAACHARLGPGLRPPHRSGRDDDGDIDVHRPEPDHRGLSHPPLLLRVRAHLRRGVDRDPIPHSQPAAPRRGPARWRTRSLRGRDGVFSRRAGELLRPDDVFHRPLDHLGPPVRPDLPVLPGGHAGGSPVARRSPAEGHRHPGGPAGPRVRRIARGRSRPRGRGEPPSIDVQGEAAAFALGTVLILLGILSLIVAWGLWTLQPWAQNVAILFAIVSLGTDVVSIVTGNYENAVALLIDLFLIWYLTRPGVRAAFVRVDRSAQGTRGPA